MTEKNLLQELIEAFQCLPGVGLKSAQRMSFYLLERDRQGATRLAQRLQMAVDKIGHCKKCRTLTESELCNICANASRLKDQLCVVENPSDVLVIEQNTDYRGLYHVLMGRLSPLDGIGPEELGLDLLEQRFESDGIREVILATNSTVEGDVTAHVINEMAVKRNIRTTRLAQGVPVGGELEYLDGGTLSHAFSARLDYQK